MGVDIELYFLRRPQLNEEVVYCDDHLYFTNFFDVFEQLFQVPGKPAPTIPTRKIPETFSLEIYRNGELFTTRTDRYYRTLRYVLAQDLKRLILPDDAGQKLHAILAFVAALPADTPIILYLW